MNNNQNMFQAFTQQTRQTPDALAIRDGQVEITYRDLLDRSRRAARVLLADGVGKGDAMAIWSVNRAEWVIAALAIQAVGGVLVPLNTRLRGGEVAAILQRAHVKWLFCDSGFGSYRFVHALAEHKLDDVRYIVCFDGPEDGAGAWADVCQSAAAAPEAALDARIAEIGPDDLVDMLFTSGTTGNPKGVPMTHRQSLLACAAQQDEICHFAPGDSFCIIFPFAHNAGYRAGWQICLLYGVRIVPVRDYDAGALLRLLQAENPVYVPAAPPIFRAILEHPELKSFDLSSIRIASTGGTDVPVALVTKMRTDLGAQAVITGYGLTETAGSVTSTQAGDPDEVVALTAGRRLSMLDVKCVDAALQEVPVGTAGEILVRGPQVLKQYFEDPAATEAAFTGDGFFRTGDIGVLDAAGNLSITGRLKDMFIVGGFNCYPAEIEKMLSTVSGVAEVAVIGVPDDRLGEVCRAFIVRQPGASLSEPDVIAWSRANMANYKVPRSVVFIDDLPRNTQGKILKTHLRTL